MMSWLMMCVMSYYDVASSTSYTTKSWLRSQQQIAKGIVKIAAILAHGVSGPQSFHGISSSRWRSQ